MDNRLPTFFSKKSYSSDELQRMLSAIQRELHEIAMQRLASDKTGEDYLNSYIPNSYCSAILDSFAKSGIAVPKLAVIQDQIAKRRYVYDINEYEQSLSDAATLLYSMIDANAASAEQDDATSETIKNTAKSRWITIDNSDDTKELIQHLSGILEEVCSKVKASNLPDGDGVLTEIEKQQLIITLETVLNMLRGPMVETGILQDLQDSAKQGAETAVKKGVEKGLGEGLKHLSEWLGRFIASFYGWG